MSKTVAVSLRGQEIGSPTTDIYKIPKDQSTRQFSQTSHNCFPSSIRSSVLTSKLTNISSTILF